MARRQRRDDAVTDLAGFLLQRITEDETHIPAGGCGCLLDDDIPVEHGFACPVRIRAECDAKRRIIERHRECGTGHGYCDDGGHGWGDGLPLGCADLADLAAPYADHPAYRQEWRL
jgi:hypothetical protein